MGIQRDPMMIKEFEKMMEINLDLMENVWLKDNLFLAGDKMTAADIFGACEVDQTREFLRVTLICFL